MIMIIFVLVYWDKKILQIIVKQMILKVLIKIMLVIRKTPIRYVSIYDYNLKFNLKREIELSNKDGEVLDLKEIGQNWASFSDIKNV